MKSIRFIGLFVGLTILAAPTALAQFDSGSDGSNGPFPPVDPGADTSIILDLRDGSVTYQPSGLTVFLPNIPAGGFQNGVLRFTTVEVPAGVTWRFIENAANSVVSILAQGNVDVLGTINLSGEAGGSFATGRGGFGGPGGFKGGNGQILISSSEAGHGMGPGGGKGGGFGADPDGIGGGGGGGFGSAGANGGNVQVTNNRGGSYGTLSLLPLVGGSGAGGGSGHESNPALGSGGGGGGGGGAILIASSAPGTINVSGSIVAKGGNGGAGIQSNASGGGGGSGGGVRLMAETLSGAGSINTSGGSFVGTTNRRGGNGGLGRIRLEAVFFNYTGTATGIVNNGGLGVVFIPNLPTVTIVSVGGVAVPADPTGYIGGTDVIIAGPGIATVELEATQVPPGTTISVTAKPETDDVVIGPVVSLGLIGTLANAATSVDLDFPSGGIYFLEAIATFVQAP